MTEAARPPADPRAHEPPAVLCPECGFAASGSQIAKLVQSSPRTPWWWAWGPTLAVLVGLVVFSIYAVWTRWDTGFAEAHDFPTVLMPTITRGQLAIAAIGGSDGSLTRRVAALLDDLANAERRTDRPGGKRVVVSMGSLRSNVTTSWTWGYPISAVIFKRDALFAEPLKREGQMTIVHSSRGSPLYFYDRVWRPSLNLGPRIDWQFGQIVLRSDPTSADGSLYRIALSPGGIVAPLMLATSAYLLVGWWATLWCRWRGQSRGRRWRHAQWVTLLVVLGVLVLGAGWRFTGARDTLLIDSPRATQTKSSSGWTFWAYPGESSLPGQVEDWTKVVPTAESDRTLAKAIIDACQEGAPEDVVAVGMDHEAIIASNRLMPSKSPQATFLPGGMPLAYFESWFWVRKPEWGTEEVLNASAGWRARVGADWSVEASWSDGSARNGRVRLASEMLLLVLAAVVVVATITRRLCNFALTRTSCNRAAAGLCPACAYPLVPKSAPSP